MTVTKISECLWKSWAVTVTTHLLNPVTCVSVNQSSSLSLFLSENMLDRSVFTLTCFPFDFVLCLQSKRIIKRRCSGAAECLFPLNLEDRIHLNTLTITTEIKLNWLGDFPGANRMQAAYSPCHFAYDSCYLTLCMGKPRPCQVKKAWKAFSSHQLA